MQDFQTLLVVSSSKGNDNDANVLSMFNHISKNSFKGQKINVPLKSFHYSLNEDKYFQMRIDGNENDRSGDISSFSQIMGSLTENKLWLNLNRPERRVRR